MSAKSGSARRLLGRLRSQEAGMNRSRFLHEHAPSIAVVAISVVALSVGWQLFTGRLLERTDRARAASGEVARIWGGPLLQPQPEVRWRRADAATVELEAAELKKSEVTVDLDVDYRRRGITEYPGYEALVRGEYQFENPSEAPAFVAFTIGLPVERSALMLRDLVLLVDGREDAAHTEYAPDGIAWRGRVDKAARFTLSYRARGLERFGYRFAGAGKEGARPVTAFKMQVRVKNLRGVVDFPVGSMAPTRVAKADGARVFEWDVERLLTSFDIGLVLPDKSDLAGALGRLIRNAPFFYLLFAAALSFALSSLGRRARALHVAGLSAAYFLYFPLAAYLSAYLPWPIACGLSLAGIAALMLLHVERFVGARVAARVGLVVLFFLATPAVAYLLPAHTGLILVLVGFVALATGLNHLGDSARRLVDEEATT
jgi:hypothetical protein